MSLRKDDPSLHVLLLLTKIGDNNLIIIMIIVTLINLPITLSIHPST